MTKVSDALQRLRNEAISKNHGWHSSDDRLGNRRVFLDGREIKGVMRANEIIGKAFVADLPLRLDKCHKKIRTHVVRGVIRVEFLS